MVITDQVVIERLTKPKCGVCHKKKYYDTYLLMKPIRLGKYNRAVCDDCLIKYPEKSESWVRTQFDMAKKIKVKNYEEVLPRQTLEKMV